MNNLQFIKNQIFTSWGGVKELSKKTNRFPLLLMAELIYCYLRYGALPRQFIEGNFYNKRAFERKNILTYRKICNLYGQLNNVNDIHLVENKAHFNSHFKNYTKREWILSSEKTEKEIKDFIRKHGSVICKPLNECEGHGIFKFELNDQADLIYLSDVIFKKTYIIEEILIQHHGMNFNNNAVNTVRVHTLMDDKEDVHILSCILRVGVGNSIVDNYNSGGVIYPVDVENGIIIGKGFSRNGKENIVHPGTDIIMLGFKIPNWNILCEEIKKAAKKIPSLRLIGWDVAITDDGIALIEANHNPDYELFEFIGDGNSYKKIKSILNK